MWVFEDVEAMAAAIADCVAGELDQAVGRSGTASLVLAGGSTPESSYRQLASRPVDWSRVDVFWGDERCVPPDAPESNYRMALGALLAPARVPTERLHRIEGEVGPRLAAERYERLLRTRMAGDWPRFDVVTVGVGEDGHVASVFPGDAESAGGRWVVPVERDAPEISRVSLTLDALGAARRLLVLATGARKAQIVARALAGKEGALPVVRLAQRAPGLIWFLDRVAAGEAS